MKILILNWRDIKNPESGGAEVLTHEIAKRWVIKGHQVIQISSCFPHCQKREILNGVKIIRLGHWRTIQICAFFYYLFYLRKKTDVIIDEVHWLPFFSVIYAPRQTVLLACEVANKLFFHLFPLPLAFLGRFLEKIYLNLYKNTPVLTISPSTRQDLLKEGFKKEMITLLPMGVNTPILKIYPKEKEPTLIFLARIQKQKGIEETLKTMVYLQKELPTLKLWVVGRVNSDYYQEIKKEIKHLKIKKIQFFGFVPEKKKFELLSKAHLLIVPSFHEGWGLTVPEAGRMKTPAVAYDVAGLKDVVKNDVNGFLVKPHPQALAKAIVTFFHHPQDWSRLQKGAFVESQKYDWDKTAQVALSILGKL